VKETINSWIIRDDEQTRQSIRYRNKNGELKKRKVRFNVCLCTKCNRVYEMNVFTNDGAKTYYYKGFPTYKLERKECVYCKEVKE
tara:strand:- start:179 stop:433 length:255 start_codon:yes stop_codon:yes gene_type:complete